MKWLTLTPERRKAIIDNINFKTGLAVVAIEKDFYVTAALKAVFQTPWADQIVFKGGTSLSKGWNLISRFSEDVDLAISPAALGMDPASITNGTQVTKLRKINGKFMEGPFLAALTEEVRGMGINEDMLGIRICPPKASDEDPRIIQLEFPTLYPTGKQYVKKTVDLEIGARSLREPFEQRRIISLVDEHMPEISTGLPVFNVPAVTPDRTFLEKMFLLHENFVNKPEKMRHFRMSRHLYDLYYVSQDDFGKSALQNTELFETIRNHRSLYYAYPQVTYADIDLQKLVIIPPSSVTGLWEKDYSEMRQNMMAKDPPDFATIVQHLATIRENDKGKDVSKGKNSGVAEED